MSPEAHGETREVELLGKPLKIAYGIVLGLLALSLLGLLLVHLNSSAKGTSAGRESVRTTTKSARQSTTTTTASLPAAPRPSPEVAAQALVSSWSSGNRLAALSVATPTAVATLLAVPYPNGLALDRGCSTAFSPIVCTFGPPGGASPNDPIYQLLVTQTSGGWYVSSVKIEH